MTRQSKEEYLAKMRIRYARAGRAGRSRLLDECEKVCGYHRKHLIRLLGQPPKPAKGKPGPKSKYALPGVLKALEDLWLLMNRPCSKLFQGNMPVRTRPDHKDDNAYAEQRNWTHVRQLLGYQRIENPDLLPVINELYQAWDLMHNLFCCTQKLEPMFGSSTAPQLTP